MGTWMPGCYVCDVCDESINYIFCIVIFLFINFKELNRNGKRSGMEEGRINGNKNERK